jgi:hypothetical protein
VSPRSFSAAGTPVFSPFCFCYLSDNSGADAPVEAELSVSALYVNRALPLGHDQYLDAAHHTIALDTAPAITEYRVFMKGRDVVISWFVQEDEKGSL